jgi:hypothetical protein
MKVLPGRLAGCRAPRYPFLMRMIALMLFGGCLLSGGPGLAADHQAWRYATPLVVGPHPPVWRYTAPNPPPFARSARSQAVWDSDACWSECGAYCAWALNGCLYEDTQGRCLAYTDACDRYCQRSCRSYGGPFLPIE